MSLFSSVVSTDFLSLVVVCFLSDPVYQAYSTCILFLMFGLHGIKNVNNFQISQHHDITSQQLLEDIYVKKISKALASKILQHLTCSMYFLKLQVLVFYMFLFIGPYILTTIICATLPHNMNLFIMQSNCLWSFNRIHAVVL